MCHISGPPPPAPRHAAQLQKRPRESTSPACTPSLQPPPLPPLSQLPALPLPPIRRFFVVLVRRFRFLVAKQLFVALAGKRIVQLAGPALDASAVGGAVRVVVQVGIVQHFELVFVAAVLEALAPLQVEVDAEAGAEEDDHADGAVDPDLGLFGDAEGGEEAGEELVRHGGCGGGGVCGVGGGGGGGGCCAWFRVYWAVGMIGGQ